MFNIHYARLFLFNNMATKFPKKECTSPFSHKIQNPSACMHDARGFTDILVVILLCKLYHNYDHFNSSQYNIYSMAKFAVIVFEACKCKR